MTMGTASTMTAIAEAIGLTLPGASSIPAADADHARMAAECGRRIVEMVWDDLTPARILTPRHVRERDRVAMAMGCSTNAIIHLVAMARRAGFDDRPRRLRPRQPQGAGDRQHPAERRHLPDGGLLLRRRPAGADEPASRAHLQAGRAHRQRPHARREHRRRQGVRRRRDPRRRHRRSTPRARSRCCAATSRPTGCVIKPSACAPRAAAPHRPGARVRRLSGAEGRGRRREPRRHRRRTCWCCATPARRAAPACPSGACCRSRRSC